MGMYDIFCAALYSVATPADGVVWQRLQYVALPLVIISFSWFLLIHLSAVMSFPRRTRIAVTAFCIFFLIASGAALLDRGLYWDAARPMIKRVALPFGFSVTYNECAAGPLATVTSGAGFAFYIYMFWLVIRAHRAGFTKRSIPLIRVMVLFFLAMINDTAVYLGLYGFAYVMEYAYMGIVVLINISLTTSYVETSIVREALRASEDRFRGLVETTSDWIWEVDAEGSYTYSSPKVFDLLGYRPEEVVGKRKIFDFLLPAKSGRTRELFRELAHSHAVIERLESVNLRKDGRFVVLETSGIPVLDAGGELAGYRGIDRNVTERNRIEENLRRHTGQLEALRQLGMELTAELDLETLLKSVVSRARELLRVSSGGFYLYDRGRDLLEWRLDQGPIALPPGSTLRRGEGLAGKVWERNETLFVNDYKAWEGRTPKLDMLPDLASVGSPVRWGEEFFGVLSMMNDTTRPFDARDAELLDLFASQAAIALRNARLYESARSRAERLSVVGRIATAVGASLGLDEVLETVCRETTGVFDPDSLFIALFDEKTREIEMRVRVDDGARLLPEKIPMGDGLASRVLLDKKPLLIRDMLRDGPDPAAGRRDGRKIMRSWLGVPMLWADRVIGVISVQAYKRSAYGEDDQELLSTIAEQVAAAVERARLYQTLRESEERYRMLFERASDAVILQSFDGLILDVNPRACQLLGATREELLSKTSSQIVSADSFILLPRRMEHTPGPVRVEGEYLRKDGSRVSVEASMVLFQVAGKPVVLVLAHDIAERKRVEERLRQAQKMEAIGTLAGGIAHDFNNILTGILGYASLLRQELKNDDPLSADVEAIAAAARRAAELTEQLLTFSRRSPQMQLEPVDPNEVARDVARLLERTIDKSIRVDARLSEDPVLVRGNAGQLHQALLNLCLNARDAMPNGGFLRIETRRESPAAGREAARGERVVISISDTGIGMDGKVKERIFEPFFTTKEKGRGLGLAMVYGITRGHGGEIRVRSEPGKGSTFEIDFPAIMEHVRIAPPVGAPLVRGGTETILVVDDEAAVRGVLQRILELGGYKVMLAEDGLEGVETYRRLHGDIDLVILDMAMPRMSGTETYENLFTVNPRVKVLISSGYSEEGRASDLIEKGALGFLKKPYEIQAVHAMVRDALDGKP